MKFIKPNIFLFKLNKLKQNQLSKPRKLSKSFFELIVGNFGFWVESYYCEGNYSVS